MPHVPYPGYDSEDYLDVEKQYGSADGVGRLAAACHARGLKLMLDIASTAWSTGSSRGYGRISSPSAVPRHPCRGQPLPHEAPGFFMQHGYREARGHVHVGVRHRRPGLRDHMVEAMSLYVRRVRRRRVPHRRAHVGPLPDWTEGRPHRASASIYGSVKLFEQARAAIHRWNPEVVFYSEAPGPVFARGFDLFYDYDHQWLYSALLQPKSDKGYLYIAAFPDERISAADMAVWLEQLRLVKPAAPRACTTSTRATPSGGRTCSTGARSSRERGAGALRTRRVPRGPLMMYAHAEDGMEDFYRDILRMKRSLPAVDRGDIDCLAVGCDNERRVRAASHPRTQVVVPVINIADSACAATLALPVDRLGPGDAWIVTDRVDGMVLAGPGGRTWKRGDLAAVKVALGPFQYRFLS